MKQEIPAQNIQPERPSVRYEHNPELTINLPYKNVELNNLTEQYNQKVESASAVSEAILSTMLPNPVADSVLVDDMTTVSGNPSIAGDDDLIEKEWVEKAKKIVAETRDNPHQRDEAVNNLQVDYLRKRYGRKLGVTE